MKEIILASASPRRREIMTQVGIKFTVVTSDMEECYTSCRPEEVVKELALLKARDVAGKTTGKDLVVIGADTIVVQEGRILGKPGDEADAFGMLDRLQGKPHSVYTGVALLSFDKTGVCRENTYVGETKVFVCSMSSQEIWDYIRSGEPMDKAGAYGIQGRFAAYIDRIEGDYYNVVGLPISYICKMLKEEL